MRNQHRWFTTVILVMTITPLWSAQDPTTAPRRGGPPGRPPGFDPGRMMMVRAVEAYWLALTFELKTPSAKLNELRPKFQQAWDKRKKAFETARTSRDFAAFHASLEKVNADLESALKKSLGTTQFKKLKETAENIMIPRRARINYSKSGKGG